MRESTEPATLRFVQCQRRFDPRSRTPVIPRVDGTALEGEPAETAVHFTPSRVHRCMEDAFTVDVHVRYNDLDTYGHVNNAVYGTYIEEARIAYLEEVLGMDLEEFTFVIANLELSFERPVATREDLEVAVETTSLGTSSATMRYELRVDDERVATGETTLVSVDREEKRPAPISDELRARIVEYEGLEE